MGCEIVKRFIILLIFCFITFNGATAATVVGYGYAPIEKGNMREAAKTALNNALINSVKNYYKKINPDSPAPDITSEYFKFIRSYRVVSKNISGYSFATSVICDIDTVALEDANILISNPTDAVVYAFSGMPARIIDNDEMNDTISSALARKNFTTLEEGNFLYALSSQANKTMAEKAFQSVDSSFLFVFSFEPLFTNLEDVDNKCELITSTEVIFKDGTKKSLKTTTGSARPNNKQCIGEALANGLENTINYIRESVIQNKNQERKIYSFKIKAINFPNMVVTNKFFSMLKERAIINSFKNSSFSAREFTFDVDSYFDKEILKSRILKLDFDIIFDIDTYLKGLELNFIKMKEEPKPLDNATVKPETDVIQE